MKVLLIGDIFGRPGRRAMRECIDGVMKDHQVDFVVANAENAAGGFGLTPPIAKELFDLGADVLTGGNHTWDKPQVIDLLESNDRVLRPENYPRDNPGSGIGIVKRDGVRVAVINLQGRVFMPQTDCPFRAIDRLLEHYADEADIFLVDFHGEASSEKMAMGRHLDGRVSALVGTHTHVQTADEQIFPEGMAYITDLGMTGPHDGIIGVKTAKSLGRFLDGRPSRFEPASGDLRFHGVVVDVDEETAKARGIERVQIRLS